MEDSHILNSLTWLSQKQKENGCFQHSGSLLNNAIKVMMPLIWFWFLKRVIRKSGDALVYSSSPGDIVLRKDGKH